MSSLRFRFLLCGFIFSASVASLAGDFAASDTSAEQTRVTNESTTHYWVGPQLGEQVQTGISNRDQNFHSNYGLAFGAEFTRPKVTWGLTADVNDQRDSSVSGNLNVNRERVAAGLNLQVSPSFFIGTNYIFYGLIGVEYFQDQVQTNFGTLTSTDYGTWQPIGRAGLGFWYTFLGALRVGCEGRILDSAVINPQITEELVLRAAYYW